MPAHNGEEHGLRGYHTPSTEYGPYRYGPTPQLGPEYGKICNVPPAGLRVCSCCIEFAHTYNTILHLE